MSRSLDDVATGSVSLGHMAPGQAPEVRGEHTAGEDSLTGLAGLT
jgi:hypothetical protein